MAAAASVKSRISEGEELARELRRRVSGDVRVDSYTRALYSTDASIFQMEPVGVVLPRSHEDVVAVMEIASKNGVWVLPRCGDTHLGERFGAGPPRTVSFSLRSSRIHPDPREEKQVAYRPVAQSPSGTQP